MKRILPILLILSLIMQSSFIGYANQNIKNESFTDIKGHWAEEIIKRHHKKGILSGYPDGTFRPNDQMKRSELITLINKYFGLKEKSEKNFIDVSEKEWYSNETAKAKYYGYLEDLLARPEEPATREDVVNMISLILDIEEQKVKAQTKEFKDLKGIDEKTEQNIDKFSAAGYINGYEDNTFKPKGIINRAEIMTIAENVLGYIVISQEDVDNMPDKVEKVTIINPNITIENKEIKGDIYISPGVNGKVTIKNTKIKGQIDVSGGTIKNPITLEDVDIKKVVITKVKETPQVKIIGKSKVDELKTKAEAKIEISGETKVKEIKTKSKTELKIKKGVKVEKLVTEGETKIDTEKGSTIGNLETNKKTEVTGEGTIKKAEIKNEDVEIEKKPEYIKIDDKVKEVKVENKKMNHTNDDHNSEESSYDDSDDDDSRDNNNGGSNNLKDTTPPKWLITPRAEMKTSESEVKIVTQLDEEATVYYSVYESKYDDEIEFTIDNLISDGNVYDAESNTVTQEVYKDGIKTERSYNVYLVAVDKNGNKQKTVEKIKVIEIDTTKPDTLTADVLEGFYNENQEIQLFAEEGAIIYYTINGDTPTIKSSKYEGKIQITETTTIRAIAVDEAGNISDVFIGEYIIDKVKPNAPTSDVATGLYNENKDIELSAEEGATIYYTIDGSEPTKGINKYEGKIQITETTTIRAIAVDKAGNISDEFTANYEIDKEVPNAPIADVEAKAYNTNQKVKLTSNEETTIYYTVDGSEPTKDSSEYTKGMEIEITETTTIKAIAIDEAGNTSGVFTGEYIIDKIPPNTPTINLQSKAYYKGQNIILTSDEGTDIYYTIDGSEPTKDSKKYANSFEINNDTKIRAIAIDAAGNKSSEFTETYTYEDGTEEKPFTIWKIDDLARVGTRTYGWDLDKYYKLMVDLDFNQDSSYYNHELKEQFISKDGWKPIGDYRNPFKGKFDGNNKKISNLYMNRTAKSYLDYYGLFSKISFGEIRDLTLEKIKITIEGEEAARIGGLVGGIECRDNQKAEKVEINNCIVTGEINAKKGLHGGLVGYISSSDRAKDEIKIFNCSTSVDIIAKGGTVGGLVGSFLGLGTIENSYATGNISVTIDKEYPYEVAVGGLVGSFSLNDYSAPRDIMYIKKSYAKGNISIDGGKYSYAGGLIGSFRMNKLFDCYATGKVTVKSQNQSYAGGLLGSSDTIEVHNSYATGDVITSNENGSTKEYVGGLAGQSGGAIYNSIAYNSKISIDGENGDINRICGNDYGMIYINNYAKDGMVIEKNGTIKSVTPNLNTNQGKGITSSEFKKTDFYLDKSNFNIDGSTKWDFTNTWKIQTGADRPILRGVGNDDGKL